MGLIRNAALQSALFMVCFACLAAASGASTFILADSGSDSVLETHGSGGRRLLQTKTSCPVNFEFLNYTIITSQCKGPRYPADKCCGALKEFACPYADKLNDLTNDCASTMFSYINLYGKYPPGLFANECREGKEGLSCPDTPTPQLLNDASANSNSNSNSNGNANANAGHINRSIISFVTFICGVVLAFSSS